MTNRITEGNLFLHQRSGLKENNYDMVTGKIESKKWECWLRKCCEVFKRKPPSSTVRL